MTTNGLALVELPHDAVTAKEGHPITTSQQVAKVFGKRHRDVLRTIRELDVPSEFNERNFALVTYLDDHGQTRPMAEITRDGFTLLAMGFTGKEAIRFKLAYIKAFNKMEETLKNILGAASGAYEAGRGVSFERLVQLQGEVINLQRFKLTVLEERWKPSRRKNGTPVHMTNELAARCYDLRAARKSLREIALTTGISEAQLSYFFRHRPSLPFGR